MAKHKSKNADDIRILHDFALIKGEIRKEYFAEGGTLAGRRGVHTVTKNEKAFASKNACRQKIEQ